MSEHCPEAANRLRRQSRREHRHVALQVAAYKGSAPREAYRVVSREEAFGKAASRPQPIRISNPLRQLEEVAGAKLEVVHSTGEGFGRLSHEHQRCGSERQKMSDSLP